MFYVVTDKITTEYGQGYVVFGDMNYSVLDTDDCVIEEYNGFELVEIRQKVYIENYYSLGSKNHSLGTIYYSEIMSLLKDRLRIVDDKVVSYNGKPLCKFFFTSDSEVHVVHEVHNKAEENIVVPVYSDLYFENIFFSYAQRIKNLLYLVVSVSFMREGFAGSARVDFAFILSNTMELSLFSVAGTSQSVQAGVSTVPDIWRIKDRSLASRLVISKAQNDCEYAFIGA